jgi:hypothetical protein
VDDPIARHIRRRDLGRLIFVAVFALAMPGLLYFGNHDPSAVAVVAVLATVLSYIALCAVVVFWILARLVRFRLHRSPMLLGSAAILVTLPWTVRYGTIMIDWARLQLNRAYYEEKVSVDLSKVHTFDWGASGIAGVNTNSYQLVFDKSDQTKSSGYPQVGMGCGISVVGLGSHFYSVTTFC